METLDAARIGEAFTRLNQELSRRDLKVELYLVGGAVMCLALNARPSTKDVDGWFTEPVAVRDAARLVAHELNLPEDWLNDAAKAFIPAGARFERWRSLTNLEISIADDRTMLAMKCAAARTTEDTGDIHVLAERLGLRTSAAVLEVVLAFYPAERLPISSRLLLEEMFS